MRRSRWSVVGVLVCATVLVPSAPATAATSSAKLRQQLKAAQRQVKTLKAQNATLRKDNTTLKAQTLGLQEQVAALTAARDARTAERDQAAAQRDQLAADKAALTTQRDQLAADKAALATERDALAADKATLTSDLAARNAEIAAARTALGAAGTLADRIAAVSAQVLGVPSGVLFNDVLTARGLLTSTPGPTLQSDITVVNALIGGSGTTTARIGTPTVNGISSDLLAAIGGTGSSLADRIGDPVVAGGGLAALIKASSATNGGASYDAGAVTNLQNATSLSSQLTSFIALFNPSSWANAAHTTITFQPSSPTSLADVVSSAAATG